MASLGFCAQKDIGMTQPTKPEPRRASAIAGATLLLFLALVGLPVLGLAAGLAVRIFLWVSGLG